MPKANSPVELANVAALLHRKYGSTLDRRSAASDAGVTLESLLLALQEFQECVRYLNTRRSKGAVLQLTSEADIQDALYLMLRPWVRDLIPENPTDRAASRFTIKDLLIPSLRTVIEAKFIRDKDHGKAVSKELHDDIEMYRRHAYCSHLIFFIYDSDSLIPDQRALAEQIEVERLYGGVRLQCYVIIKP